MNVTTPERAILYRIIIVQSVMELPQYVDVTNTLYDCPGFISEPKSSHVY